MILWHSPDPRAVLLPEDFRLSRRLARRMRAASGLHWRVDGDFRATLANCAAGPLRRGGVWLGTEMIEAYAGLHAAGRCRSFEAWDGEGLRGGILVIQIGAYVIGESMYSLRVDGSKMALAGLLRVMGGWPGSLLDCQFMTRHLRSLGASEIPRAQFEERIRALVRQEAQDLKGISPRELQFHPGWERG